MRRLLYRLLARLPRLKAFINRILNIVGYRLTDSRNGLLSAKDSLERAIYELCTRADENGIDRLPARHRTVVHAWAAHGIIGNGGFQYYYEGAWMMADVAAAYRTLGFEEAACACESSLDIFPARVPPRDRARRWEIINKTDFEALREAETKIFDVRWDSLKAAIADYMAKHDDDFSELGALPNRALQRTALARRR
jgi:hypothetical protein